MRCVMLSLKNLYDKYIRIGSEFESNISDNNRTQLIDRMRHKQLWLNNNYGISSNQLFVMFDNACLENVKLLQFSLMRLLSKREKKGKLRSALRKTDTESPSLAI